MPSTISVEYALNRAQPAEVHDLLRYVKDGTLFRGYIIGTTENLAVVANVGTLHDHAGNVTAVSALAAGPGITAFVIVPPGVAPATGQVAWDGDQTLTFNAGDAVTFARCRYNYVPDEAFTRIDALWPNLR